MCLASSLDPTVAPPGCHVASLFTQYTPYSPSNYTKSNGEWTDEARQEYTNLSMTQLLEIKVISFSI